MTSNSSGTSGRLAFRISPELLARAEAALEAVRGDPTHPPHVKELVAVILELTDTGLDYYFLEPLRRVRIGTVGMSTARLGIAAAGRSIPPIVRRVLTSMDEEQILEIADFLDELLIRDSDLPISSSVSTREQTTSAASTRHPPTNRQLRLGT